MNKEKMGVKEILLFPVTCLMGIIVLLMIIVQDIIHYIRHFFWKMTPTGRKKTKELTERLERAKEEGKKIGEERSRRWKREEEILSIIKSVENESVENINKSSNSEKLWGIIEEMDSLSTKFIIALKGGTDENQEYEANRRKLFIQKHQSELDELRIHLKQLDDLITEVESLNPHCMLAFYVSSTLSRACSFL